MKVRYIAQYTMQGGKDFNMVKRYSNNIVTRHHFNIVKHYHFTMLKRYALMRESAISSKDRNRIVYIVISTVLLHIYDSIKELRLELRWSYGKAAKWSCAAATRKPHEQLYFTAT